MRIVGTNRLYIQFIVVLFSIVTLLAVNEILFEINIDLRIRKRTIYLIGLLPNYAIISSILLRESIVAMFISLSLLYFIKWYSRKQEILFWIACVFIFLGCLFHSGAVSVVIGYIVVRLLYDNKKSKLRLSFKTIIPTLIMIVAFVFLYNNYSELLFGKMQNIENIEDIANTHNDGGSSYGSYAGNSSNIFSMIIFTPIRIIMFLFSPFFWQIRGLSDIIALCFDSTFYMYVYYKTISQLKQGRSQNKILIILLLILGLSSAFVFGWGVSNTGTALRHRNKMIAIYAILFALTTNKIGREI